jgi:hypothetical protein
MKGKRVTMSFVLATLVLVSLFAVVSSVASVSGAPLAGTGPAVSTTFSNGQSNIFAVDSHGALWNISVGKRTWTSIGGVSTSSPAAVSWGSSNRTDVFIRGSDGALWHSYYQGGWSKWESLGGQLAAGTGPAASSSGIGRLDVFVEGTTGAMWHKAWTGAAWSGWQNLGGVLTASPAAVAGSHTSDVFVRGTDAAVWYKYYQNGWSSWKSLGGQLAPKTGPAVSGNLNLPATYLGIHRLFVQGTDHQLWLKSPVGSGWTAWAHIGMPLEALSAASPGAVANATGPTIVSITSTSGNIWYSVHTDVNGTSDNWNTWTSLRQSLTS